MNFEIKPELDLVLERVLEVPPELVWEAWTTPEHIKQFFVPKPWSIKDCAIDLRPGGRFYTVMCSPEGQEMPNEGCYLEVVPQQRLVFTDALKPGFRPAEEPFFTAAILLEPQAEGTKYTALAMHRDPEGRKKHEDMGFAEGWGTVVAQMVEYIKSW